ncbi:1037_t:CDS:2, partial [Diversispora eburnea]
NNSTAEMPCNWLLVGETHLCKIPLRGQYCASHAFKIRNAVIIPEPCKGCDRGTKSSVQLYVPCGQASTQLISMHTIYIYEVISELI